MTDIAELEMRVKTADLARAEQAQKQFAATAEQTEGRTSAAVGRINMGFGRLAAAAGALAGSIAAAFGARAVIAEAQTFETTMLRVQAVINATGGAAGRSADQLREQARELARSTLESTEGTLRAQQTLLTFRNVQGEVFDRAIRAAADMSSALGGDLNSAAMQLGRALENPIRGMAALARSGVEFAPAQREAVRAMVEAGQTAEAQRFILAALEAQYRGTAVAAAQGLAGAQDTLSQAMQELRLEIAEQLGLMDLASRANLALAGAVNTVTANMPAIITGFQTFGAVLVGIVATQVPGMIVGLSSMVAGMSAATIATGILAGAMRGLGIAVAIAGGPIGILVGLLGGAAAYMLLFRDTTETAAPIMDQAAEAVGRINGVLAQSSEQHLPAAARATLALTNENIRLAQSAFAAAEAQVALANAAQQIAGTELGLQQAFSPTGDFSVAIDAHAAATDRLNRAQADLIIAQSSLSSRINDGQLALAGAGEEIERNRSRTLDLTVTMQGLNDAIAGGAGAGGGAGISDGFAARMEALQRGLMTEREVVEAWYQESIEILADRRAREILGEEEHREALLRVEASYQEQLAALRGNSFQTGLQDASKFFTNMAEAARAGGDRMTGAVRAFSVAQGLINSYLAFTQVLADPSLIGRPFTRIALAGSTLAAGLAQVAAMRGGGGGGGASAGGVSRAPTTAPAQEQRRSIRIEVDGEGMFAEMLRRSTQQIADALFDESRRGGTTLVVAR